MITSALPDAYTVEVHTDQNGAIIPPGNPCQSTDPNFFQNVVTPPLAGGTTMTTIFNPYSSLRCGLDDVARAYGFDHFNWVQTITHYDGLLLTNLGGLPISLLPPFLDPPPGGYIGSPADLLPYYWDEGSSPLLNPKFNLSNNRSSASLTISDTPRSNQINEPDEYMGFITALVGVIGDDQWEPLATFEWKSNYNGDTGGVLSDSARDLTPAVGGTGGVFDVVMYSDPWAVPDDVRRLWLANGAVGVPSPGTLPLILLGLLAIVVSMKRRQHSQPGHWSQDSSRIGNSTSHG